MLLLRAQSDYGRVRPPSTSWDRQPPALPPTPPPPALSLHLPHLPPTSPPPPHAGGSFHRLQETADPPHPGLMSCDPRDWGRQALAPGVGYTMQCRLPPPLFYSTRASTWGWGAPMLCGACLGPFLCRIFASLLLEILECLTWAGTRTDTLSDTPAPFAPSHSRDSWWELCHPPSACLHPWPAFPKTPGRACLAPPLSAHG